MIAKDVSDLLNKHVDLKSMQNATTLARLMDYYRNNAARVNTDPCHLAHWGLCRTRDDDIAPYVMGLIKLLNVFAKSVNLADQGKELLMFSSAEHVAYAAQGKISKLPYFQAWVIVTVFELRTAALGSVWKGNKVSSLPHPEGSPGG